MEGEDDHEYSGSPEQTAADEIESSNVWKKRNKNKRRFNDEQIRSLESMFKSQTKLEPRKKLQVARDLGLQPRQVAIWFQNRRARWKSKQIEQDYRVLRANYDNLHSQFESLKREKQSLLIQLQELSDLLEKPCDRGSGTEDLKVNNISAGSDSENGHNEYKTKPSYIRKGSDHGYSDADERRKRTYFEQGEEELEALGGQVNSSLPVPEKWCNLDSGGLLDQSCGSSHWWDIWST